MIKRYVPMRLQVAWNVLRGRPVIYRTVFVGDIHIAPGARNLMMIENSFVQEPQHGWSMWDTKGNQ